MIASYHRTIDKVTERFLGKNKVGTTGRGIGPAYADKIGARRHPRRRPLRREDPAREDRGHARAEEPAAGEGLQPSRGRRSTTSSTSCRGYAERLRPMVADTSLLINQALDEGKTVLFEGAQATMLDVDHGTYPFVTSSNADRRRCLHRSRNRTDAHRPGRRSDQGIHDQGRLRSVPDRAARRGRRPAAHGRRRVRRHHRSRAPVRLVRRGHRPLRVAGQRPHRHVPRPSSTSSAAGIASRCAWPTRSTAFGTTRCR